MPRICWNISYSCSLLRISSDTALNGMRPCDRRWSSSPLKMTSYLVIQELSTVSLLRPSISGKLRTRRSMFFLKTSRKSLAEQPPLCTIRVKRSLFRKPWREKIERVGLFFFLFHYFLESGGNPIISMTHI